MKIRVLLLALFLSAALAACYRDAGKNNANPTVRISDILPTETATRQPSHLPPTFTPGEPPSVTPNPPVGGPPGGADSGSGPTLVLSSPNSDGRPTLFIPTFTPVPLGVATLAPPGFSDTGISPTPQDIASNPLATLQPTPTEFVEEDECVYTVQSGDTLFSIATSYGFFPEDFQAINPELAVNPNSLYIGQKLNIPECDDGTGTPSPSTDGEGDVATPTPEGNTAPPGSQTYIVQAGDTLFSIALRFNVTVDAIVAATDFLVSAETIIRPGDVLIIPPPE